MNGAQSHLLLALVAVIAMGFGAGAWWLLRTPAPAAPAPEIELPPPQTVPVSREESSGAPRIEVPLEAPVAEPAAPTTVVFPLKVELELLASDVRPSADGVSALGSDAAARLAGSVHGTNAEPLAAEIEFVAGPNAGRRLTAGRDGTFGANDLYPGLSIVRVRAPGTPGSLREVLFRRERVTQMNLGYGRLGSVHGAVVDPVGDPIAEALVTVDGQEVRTDEKGEYSFPGVAAGETFLVVERPGFAAQMQKLTVIGGQATERARLVCTLRPAARLEVTIEDRINVDSEADLFVLPQSLDAERNFPWYKVNPVRVFPGGTKVIEDLPAKAVILRLFHAGAAANPPTRSATLREKETTRVDLHLVPAPVVTGVVRESGRPAVGAEVVLEAPQRSLAMLSVLGQSNYLDLEREVLPDFPPAVQRVKTNGQGEFVLNSGEGVSKERYLHATSRDGKSTAWKLLRGGETNVELALERSHGDAEFILRMDGRTQGLPVEVKVDGAPREPFVLAPGRDLHVAGLAPGTWKATVTWNAEPILEEMLVDIRQEATIPVRLPEGAIVGQDADTRKRAGK